MLNKHFIAKTSPKAVKENIVYWKDYRVTVLSGRLFRIEQSEQKKFRDRATQTVWFRNMPKQNFSCAQIEDGAIIDTGACKLILRAMRGDCRIELNGKEFLITNEGNLLGTYRTLDCCNGDIYDCPWDSSDKRKIELGTGVCSKTGIALFDDGASLSLGDNGEILPERGDGTDEYVFVYGNDYRAAVRALYSITGSVPLIPRYVLGNWWSRYHAYTDREYMQVITAFEKRNIPLTVATVDMDWHYSNTKEIDERFGISVNGLKDEKCVGTNENFGWTGYTWNEALFPDYKKFLSGLHDRGLKVTLNLHPADGVRYWEMQYEEMAKAVGKDAGTKELIPFRITDDQFLNAYFSVLMKPYEKDGVDFWWLDWQQGSKSEIEGFDPLWALNHYHYLDHAENHDVPLILSRYAGIGSHRYPLGFSGDTHITWDTLKYLPYFTATASNIGYTWWSHDIGGHMLGEKSDELYLRQIQYGVFSPINRLHGCNCATMTKEPWAYRNGTGLIAEEFLRFRHRMIPYLYSAAYDTHKNGIALVEPLYYRNREQAAYRYPNEYYFGSELLVAPVTEKADNSGYARVNVWLPEGVWTDIFTGDKYEIGTGGAEKTFLRTLDSIPVLAKAGAILPLSADQGNGCGNPERLDVWVYAGNGSYTLYEDDGDKTCFIKFTAKHENGVQSVTVCAKDDTEIIPKNRVMTLYFKDIPEGKITLLRNGKIIQTEEMYENCAAVRFAFSAKDKFEIKVNYREATDLERLKQRAKQILTFAEGGNVEKEAIYVGFKKSNSVDDFCREVNDSALSETVKKYLIETI